MLNFYQKSKYETKSLTTAYENMLLFSKLLGSEVNTTLNLLQNMPAFDIAFHRAIEANPTDDPTALRRTITDMFKISGCFLPSMSKGTRTGFNPARLNARNGPRLFTKDEMKRHPDHPISILKVSKCDFNQSDMFDYLYLFTIQHAWGVWLKASCKPPAARTYFFGMGKPFRTGGQLKEITPKEATKNLASLVLLLLLYYDNMTTLSYFAFVFGCLGHIGGRREFYRRPQGGLSH